MEEPGADFSQGSRSPMEWSGEGGRSAPALPKSDMKKRLQVMKFGGTSVGDASCITRAAKIIVNAAKEFRCVAVVSAMSGVTNRLIEAANHARAGNAGEAAAILESLRKQHETALSSLVRQEEERQPIRQRLQEVLSEGRRLCEGTALLRELTPRTLDAVSSLGERLSAPLVAAAVKEAGAASEAIEASGLIVTDADGVLTADPRLVQAARTIPEVSYREAAELAYFGAKVLHPKTLNPVVQAAIPVWI